MEPTSSYNSEQAEATYLKLRDQILRLDPFEVGINPTRSLVNAWGVLMETGYKEAPVTLVALADGTASLYFGTGGGMLGGGRIPAVANAARALVSTSEEFVLDMPPSKIFPLPAVGEVKFIVLTFSGKFTQTARVDELARGQHLLSPLYYRGDEVVTQFRLHGQKKNN
jgi:hypothetical protein